METTKDGIKSVKERGRMEKHYIIIVATILFGSIVTFQAIQLTQESGEEDTIPLWEGPWYKVPDEHLVNLTLRGSLSHTGFPYIADAKYEEDVISIGIGFKDVVTLELFDTISGNTTAVFYLYFEGFRAGCIWAGLIQVPVCENFTVGGVEIAELYEAELIEVEGYAFDVIALDKKRYHLLRVSKSRVLEHGS